MVGNTVYYTMTDENLIHMMDATTGADLGVITTETRSMSTIGWDGSSFWTSDYAGTNRAFQIALDGSTIKTITLSSANQYMDGMEWFNNKLIANRDDGGHIYDVYDLDGNLLQLAFITNPTSFSTGIAYDGNVLLRIEPVQPSPLPVFDGTTGVLIDAATFCRPCCRSKTSATIRSARISPAPSRLSRPASSAWRPGSLACSARCAGGGRSDDRSALIPRMGAPARHPHRR